MSQILEVAGIEMEVEHKDIKNVHLSVYPPEGRVRIAAPKRMRMETIRVFVISKIDWIRQQKAILKSQERETPREYTERESHLLWGERYLLHLVEADTIPSITTKGKQLIMQVRPDTSIDKREELLASWYRERVRERAAELIVKWEPKLGVSVNQLFIQTMKTRWGGCKPERGNIRLNTELAKKPPVCLEYIVVHEMLHLIEPTHNDRFRSLLKKHLPTWKAARDLLNCLPVKHEEWGY